MSSLFVCCCLFLQAQHEINNNDILAAGRQWRSACQWPYLGACVWAAVVLPFVFGGLVVGIVLVAFIYS